MLTFGPMIDSELFCFLLWNCALPNRRSSTSSPEHSDFRPMAWHLGLIEAPMMP
jgi:hypothetical protein